MAVVNITVNGRCYDIACADTQAARIQVLGRDLDLRSQDLLKSVGVVSDARLMLMVALTLADELAEAREDLSRVGEEVEAVLEGDARLADGIDALAERIEGIAERLERS